MDPRNDPAEDARGGGKLRRHAYMRARVVAFEFIAARVIFEPRALVCRGAPPFTASLNSLDIEPRRFHIFCAVIAGRRAAGELTRAARRAHRWDVRARSSKVGGERALRLPPNSYGLTIHHGVTILVLRRWGRSPVRCARRAGFRRRILPAAIGTPTTRPKGRP